MTHSHKIPDHRLVFMEIHTHQVLSLGPNISRQIPCSFISILPMPRDSSQTRTTVTCWVLPPPERMQLQIKTIFPRDKGIIHSFTVEWKPGMMGYINYIARALNH